MTLNNVISELNLIATNHYQINHFFFGNEFDFASSGTVDCPAMIVSLLPHTYNQSTLTYNFKIYIGDLVHKDLSNKNEVLSDSLLTCLDIIYKLQDTNYDWILSNINSITLNDFEDSFDCELYGYWFQISLKESKPFNRCAIPST